VGLLCDAAVELGAAKDWAAALTILADAHFAAEGLVGDGSERSWMAIQAVTQVALWLNATHEGRHALLLQEHPGTWSLLKPTIPEDKTGAVGLDTGLANAAILETRLGIDRGLVARFDERERDSLVTPLSALALRAVELTSVIDRRDVAAFVSTFPRFVSTGKVAIESKAAGAQSVAAAIPIIPVEEWYDAEWQVARHIASELMAELILDRAPAAVEAAVERLGASGMGLDYPFRTADVSQDYVAHALEALTWLTAREFQTRDRWST
jgi:hypothetical protein